MKLKNTLLIIAVNVSIGLMAQDYRQNIRGTVTDKNLQIPVSGAVVCIDNDSLHCDTSDINGQYELKDVRVGRHNISAIHNTYGEISVPGVLLNSGKELVFNIQMEENIHVFKSASSKGKATSRVRSSNEMATVSARTFTVEETQRFAAAVNDPGRMATSFAGVVGADDGGNTIVIRGNTPAGMLWRMEGIDIPGPNHFANFSGSGGGVSLLSAQLLSNSDFYTGAFPAEYGNAISGVFDLRLRKGNSKKREYTLQAGFLGIDFATEGPLTKKGGSYLVNYRYSTLGILQKLGVKITSGVTLFQDFSFNVQLPQSKLGTFSFFGFGGISNQYQNAVKDSTQWKSDDDRHNFIFGSNTGAAGMTHTINRGKNTSIRNVLLYSGNSITDIGEYYTTDYQTTHLHWKNGLLNTKLALHTSVNQKISERVHLRTGIILNHWNYRALNKEKDTMNVLRTFVDDRGQTDYGQLYAQFKMRMSNRLNLYAGFHSMYLMLNKSKSFEPRVSVKYDINKKRTISFAYGLHSQLQLPGIYFSEVTDANGVKTLANQSLGFNKSHHFVASFEQMLAAGMRFKVETYYQHLYNIPSGTNGSTTSVLNLAFGSISQKLSQDGKGRNYGVEMTLEKNLSRGVYFLISGSLYDSKYTTGNGVWYDTRFNSRHSLSITGGKEIKLKGDKKLLGLNFKTLWYGGFRMTPIDLEKSRLYNTPVYDETRTNSIQLPSYFRADIKISYRINHSKYSSIWSLDLQNASNRKNVGGTYYDVQKEEIKTWYMTPLLPILSYKIEF